MWEERNISPPTHRGCVASHLYVPCRSVCDQDQNWIKQSKPLFESRSRDQGNLWTAKIKGSRMRGCNLTFDPLKSRQSRASEGNDQATKHFVNQKSWSWSQMLWQATNKRLPIAWETKEKKADSSCIVPYNTSPLRHILLLFLHCQRWTVNMPGERGKGVLLHFNFRGKKKKWSHSLTLALTNPNTKP